MAHDFSQRSLRVKTRGGDRVITSQEEYDAYLKETGGAPEVAFASEEAEALAKEHGIDPSTIEATGKTGITKGDVEKAIEAAQGE